jgi:predicted  nucleic acid-binding Zn-ribbon protein
MLEITIALGIFFLFTAFAIRYYGRYRKFQLSENFEKRSFWNNRYLFDAIPSVFPTLGIFCTALGITIGIWNFDTNDIQGSIPQLLQGLRLAFLATMAGILGLIAFQKWHAAIQKNIDDHPDKPVKPTGELQAISELKTAIEKLNNSNNGHFEKLIATLEQKLDLQISSLEKEVASINQVLQSNNVDLLASHKQLKDGISDLGREFAAASQTANKNTGQIINAMADNNAFVVQKFDVFAELLAKNNTEALVEVMRNVTQQFNEQMNALISKLVQENFAELNSSVQSMNDWQKQNKEQIAALAAHFQKTTEMFAVSSKTLGEVAQTSKALTDDSSKLANLVQTLEKVLISDNKFSEITANLVQTIETLQGTTNRFEDTTDKLNDWVRTERNFKDSADILIVKLEEFRNMNSDVWKRYREEMESAVGIIKKTSLSLGEDLTNINGEFYDRLDETLKNLDLCIQRFLPGTN